MFFISLAYFLVMVMPWQKQRLLLMPLLLLQGYTLILV